MIKPILKINETPVWSSYDVDAKNKEWRRCCNNNIPFFYGIKVHRGQYRLEIDTLPVSYNDKRNDYTLKADVIHEIYNNIVSKRYVKNKQWFMFEKGLNNDQHLCIWEFFKLEDLKTIIPYIQGVIYDKNNYVVRDIFFNKILED